MQEDKRSILFAQDIQVPMVTGHWAMNRAEFVRS